MRDQVFISYSRRDAMWLERLQVYLAPFERHGQVRRWDDTLIAPGERWEQEIHEALERAKVAVLLVSAQFLASDFIARVELPRLLGAAEDQGVTILPLVLDWCNFERMPELAQFQSVNSPSRPLETLDESECKAMLAKLAAAVADSLQGETAEAGGSAPERGRFVGLPARNPLFTGRDGLLDALRGALESGARAALCGLPGIGKTETAIEFAHRDRQRYAWVLWSRAESAQQVIRGFCAFAAALGLPEAKGTDQLAAAQSARSALAARGDWLLVFDSADDFGLVREWLPEGEGGKVVLTSRSAALGSLAQALELEPLEDEPAARFLLRRARLIWGEAAADASLMTQAVEIVRLAGGLPLALDQAGGYIEETGCTLEEYRTLWTGHRSQLLSSCGEGGLRQCESLVDTWSLSLSDLQRANPASAALLHMMTFFHCDVLPDSALQAGARFAGPELGPVLGDAMARNEALRDAQRFAFLRRDAKTGKLSMHRLLQAVLRDELTEKDRQLLCMRALEVLNAALPEPRFLTWPQCDALAAHVLAVLDHARGMVIETEALARLACELAAYLSQRGRFAEARPLAQQALSLRQRAGDGSVAALSRALSVCGQIELAAGRLDEARARLDSASACLTSAGPSVDLARVMDIRATVDMAAGDLAAAESRLAAGEAMIRAANAAQSVEAAQIANDLGAVRFKQGDYAGARTAFAQAAALRQALLPANHPSLAQSLNNLAAVCMRVGEPGEARARYLQSLALREAALGERHPDVAETLLNLALLDLADGHMTDARREAERAIAIVEACYGVEHASVAKAYACLGDVALREGALDEAQRLYQQAREVRRRQLGAQHADTARAMMGLADVALARGEYVAAVPLLVDACTVLREKLGSSHPDAVACEIELARAREGARAQPAAASVRPAGSA
jgi:tetratricopeptide (TPR) repeat protein